MGLIRKTTAGSRRYKCAGFILRGGSWPPLALATHSPLMALEMRARIKAALQEKRPSLECALSCGGIAQLGERLHGMQEVSGSIPLTSTTNREAPGNRVFGLISPYRLEA